MACKSIVSLVFAAAVGAAAVAFADNMSNMGNMSSSDMPPTSQPASQPATQSTAMDLMNTVCPVTSDKVGDSKLTETYDGKVYHFCCADCPEAFKKEPAKYAKKVADDPAKYGVKTGS